jgi:hypothetical protein
MRENICDRQSQGHQLVFNQRSTDQRSEMRNQRSTDQRSEMRNQRSTDQYQSLQITKSEIPYSPSVDKFDDQFDMLRRNLFLIRQQQFQHLQRLILSKLDTVWKKRGKYQHCFI